MCVERTFLKQYVGFFSFFWNNAILSSCGSKALLRLLFLFESGTARVHEFVSLVWPTNYEIYGPATPHNILLIVDLTTYS